MSLYKKTVTRTGNVHYFKDGKAVKAEDVAALPAIIRNMDEGVTLEFEDFIAPLPTPEPIEEKTVKPAPTERVSVISGEPATMQRYLNGQMYWVTEEEHNTMSLGKLAQVIREKGL